MSSETHELFSAEDAHRILDTARTGRGHFAQPGQPA